MLFINLFIDIQLYNKKKEKKKAKTNDDIIPWKQMNTRDSSSKGKNKLTVEWVMTVNLELT